MEAVMKVERFGAGADDAYAKYSRERVRAWDRQAVSRLDLLESALRNNAAAQTLLDDAQNNLTETEVSVGWALDLADSLLAEVPHELQETAFFRKLREARQAANDRETPETETE